jgi:hypothetical protein
LPHLNGMKNDGHSVQVDADSLGQLLPYAFVAVHVEQVPFWNLREALAAISKLHRRKVIGMGMRHQEMREALIGELVQKAVMIGIRAEIDANGFADGVGGTASYVLAATGSGLGAGLAVTEDGGPTFRSGGTTDENIQFQTPGEFTDAMSDTAAERASSRLSNTRKTR